MSGLTCQKCRQPLAAAAMMDDSLAALSPSAYDFISSSLSDRTAPSSFDVDPTRLPTPLRPLYAASTSARALGQRGGGGALPIRVQGPSIERASHWSPSPRAGTGDGARRVGGAGAGESFVMLTESVLHPARLDSATSSTPVVGAVVPPQSTPTPSTSKESPSNRLLHLNSLMDLLNSQSPIDHPLCVECTENLLVIMSKELEDLKKERERLIIFEREFIRKGESGGPGGAEEGVELLKREILKLGKAEGVARSEMSKLEKEREVLSLEKEMLEAEETALEAEEEEFWKEHSRFVIADTSLRDRNEALQTAYQNSLRTLAALQSTNVYSDVFCIGQEAGFGTINGLRLGRLPGIAVEWTEINAAWGHTVMLLQTIKQKFGVVFETYDLAPMASFSKIVKLGGDQTSYDLFGTADFQLTRLLQNRRFDMAQVAFLDCLRQTIEFVKKREEGVKIPYLVVKDRIGDVSIRLQFGSEEVWTRALRHVLLDLKILLARASNL